MPLKSHSLSLSCGECNCDYPIDESGIINFLGEEGFYYWGEISAEEMQETIDLAEKKGYKSALDSVISRYPDLGYYLLSSARIDWLFHCLNPEYTHSCLDVGSGWGSLTFPLAKIFEEVWSLEAIRERIEFQLVRKNEDKVYNVNLVRADMLNLPFPDDYFDLVILNGVLEWAGLCDFAENPRTVQMKLLKEVKRVLKTGGCLYIGIENRFGFKLFGGAIDHSGLPFTSILPRKLADIAVRFFRKAAGSYEQKERMEEKWKDYRTYTYSFIGYEKMLKEAGFYNLELYWSFPSYNYPKYAGKLQDNQSFPFFLKHLHEIAWADTSRFRKFILDFALTLPSSLIASMWNIFSPSFLIFAYKDRRGASFETKLLNSEHNVQSFLRASGGSGTTSKVNYLLIKSGKLHSVAKFSRFQEGFRNLKEEETLVQRFNDLSVKQLNVMGLNVFVESKVIGKRCEFYNLSHNLKAWEWLMQFQRKTRNSILPFEELEKEVMNLSALLPEINISEEVRLGIRRKLDVFLKSLDGLPLEKCAEHGDFWLGNIFVDNNERVYVIDWEYYRENGNPLFDCGFFLILNSSGKANQEYFRENLSGCGKYSPILKNLTVNICQEKQLPLEVIFYNITYVLLRCIRRYHSNLGNWAVNFKAYVDLLTVWHEFTFKDWKWLEE